MIKTILNIAILVLIFVTASSCRKDGVGIQKVSNENSQKQELKTYSKDEVELGESLAKCSVEWEGITTKSDNSFDGEFVAMGIVGKQCLKIDEIEVLKTILSFYRKNRIEKNVDWKEVSKNILSMESL